MRFNLVKNGLGLVLGAALALPAMANDRKEEFVFDSYVSGIKIGVVRFNAVEKGASYALAGNMNTAGFVGLFHNMAYEASARGTRKGNSFSPSRYTETGYSGKWNTDVTVEWKGGTPRMTKHVPTLEPKPHHPDPAKEKGTIDSLTALYAALREVPAAEVCKGSWQLFDGRQGSTIKLHSPQTSGNTVVCKGDYIRRTGFTAAELASAKSFPFSVTFAARDNGMMRVAELTTGSTLGKVRMVRR